MMRMMMVVGLDYRRTCIVAAQFGRVSLRNWWPLHAVRDWVQHT